MGTNGSGKRRNSLYGFEYREPDLRRSTERKTYDIKQVWQRSHEIIKLALLGYKSVDIAKLLNIHPATVSNTLNSQLGMNKLSAMREARDVEAIDVAKEVEKLFPKAVEIYKEILHDKDASMSLRKQTADTIIMEIGGFKSPSRFEGKIAHAHLTLEELEEIKKRGREAARASGRLVEAGQ